MSTSRLVRGTKSRFFLYVCAFAAFLLVIYVFHGSQKQIEESQKSAAMCLQQQESLSAQLQGKHRVLNLHYFINICYLNLVL